MYIIDPKVFPSTSNALICMPGGFLREVNPYDEVQLELGVRIPRNWKKRKFWYIIDHKVFQSTSTALICMPEGLLREINQY